MQDACLIVVQVDTNMFQRDDAMGYDFHFARECLRLLRVLLRVPLDMDRSDVRNVLRLRLPLYLPPSDLYRLTTHALA